jgi:hypothetical protein
MTTTNITNKKIVIKTAKKVAYIGFVRGQFIVSICGIYNEGDYNREALIVLKEFTQEWRVVKLLADFNLFINKEALINFKTLTKVV